MPRVAAITARATYSAPISESAPSLFSTTTGCFHFAESTALIVRISMSEPPGGNGTTMCRGSSSVRRRWHVLRNAARGHGSGDARTALGQQPPISHGFRESRLRRSLGPSSDKPVVRFSGRAKIIPPRSAARASAQHLLRVLLTPDLADVAIPCHATTGCWRRRAARSGKRSLAKPGHSHSAPRNA